ncbi:hemagglutinin repeat-containing protein [Xanthomonas albilineans]|uniref:hemagglutinin repeat-containing protein n=1 Tax=Xanthomonas albilineans TaxID=29447 RepID=UPI0027D96E11|nr:hemagglutinin repeat-containing protein [Xanthomonas albilineans]
MNRIYRLVFNRALRVWQVASEQVRRPAGSALRGADAGPTRMTRLCWALCCVLAGVGVSGAVQAQSAGRIVGDPNAPGAQRPTVLNAANGVPLVNITTPSAAGVSRNSYSQFDVGGQGAILNNSPVQSQTQLGGWVQGNPWLSTGAKVILNEVNGPVSHLGGYVEVAGARAEVVIANPAGIQVDGGGFLNASRVTLTTGTPLVSNGALDGYRVSGGTIQITGAGLDSRGADYTGLLARAVQINAGIWANQVQAVLGSNVVSADQRQIAAQAASGAAPAFALDVGALGGMFANKIWLIGNEHGVGVRNAGNLGAQAGELVVTVDGRLENSGALQSQQDTQIAASGGIANAGVVSARGTLQVSTAADVDNSGGTLNAQRLQIAAAALRNQGGKIEQTGMQALGVNAGSLSNRAQGSLGTVAGSDGQGNTPAAGTGTGTSTGTGTGAGTGAAGNTSGSGTTPTSGSGQTPTDAPLAAGLLNVTGALDNDGGRIEGAGPIAVSVAAGLDNSAGRLGVAALSVRGDLRNQAGTLAVYGDADLQLGALVNDQGHLDVANALGLNAASLSNQGGSLRHGGSEATAWHVQGLLDNTGGVLSSNAAAWQLDAQTVVNVNGRIAHSGTQGLSLTAQDWSGVGGQIATPGALVWRGGSIDHRAATASASVLDVQADRMENQGGSLLSTGTQAASVQVRALLDNGAGGSIVSNGDLSLGAGTFGNANGQVQQAGSGMLRIAAGSLAGSGGRLLSNGGLSVSGGAIDLSGGATSAQWIGISADSLSTAGGQLTSLGTQTLALQVQGALNNHGGRLLGNAGIALQAGALDNGGGTLLAAGHDGAQLTIGGALDNSQGGRLAASGDVSVRAATLDNTQGAIEHAGAGTLSVAAQTLQGAGGKLLTQGSLQLSGGDLELGAGSTTQANQITLLADTLNTAGGHVMATGDQAMTLRLSGALDNDGGSIAGNGALAVQVGALSNRGGTLTAAGSAASAIAVSGQLDNTQGTVASNGSALSISADQLINAHGTLSHTGSQGLTLTANGVTNTQGSIVSSAALTLTANTVDQRQGTLGAASLQVQAGTLDNSGGGRIVASGTAASALHAQSLNNAGGTVTSNGDLSLQATTLDNTQGTIQHAGNGQLQIAADTLRGSGGSIVSNGTLGISGQNTDLSQGTTTAQTIAIATGTLDNSGGGRIVASGTAASVLHAQTLNNAGGTVASNGDLTLQATSLDNTQGAIQHAGTGQLQIAADTLSGSGGSIVSNGTLGISGQNTDLSHGTTTAQTIAIATGTLDNSGGGRIVASGNAASVLHAQSLNNAGGTVASNGDLSLQATTLDNTQGAIQHAGNGQLQIAADTLRGSGGSIVSNGTLGISGQSTDLSQGTTSAQTLGITTGMLSTAGGHLTASGTQALNLNVGGTLDNTGGAIGGNGVFALNAQRLLNAQGSVQAAGQGLSTLHIAQDLQNQQGKLLLGGPGQINAASLANQGGIVSAAGSALQVQVDGALDNHAHGVLSSGGQLALTAGTLDNSGTGTVVAGGDLSAQIGGALDNDAGLLQANGAAQLQSTGLSNRAGSVVGGTLSVDTQGQALDNSGGTLGSQNGALSVHSGPLLNAGGRVQAKTDLSVQTDGQAIVNTGSGANGGLLAGGRVQVDGGSLDNRGGVVFAQGDARLGLNSVDNSAAGSLSAAGNLALNAATLNNAGGRVQGGQNLALSLGGDLNNQAGLLAANGLLSLTAATLDNRNTFTAGNALGVQAGQLQLQAQALNNQQGQLLSNGASSVQLSAGLDNSGGRIASGGSLNTHADALTNTAGMLRSQGNQFMAARALSGDGQVQSQGDLSLSLHERLTNTGQLIANGNLSIHTDGDLLNQGVLRADNLDLSAANLDNTASGEISSQGVTHVQAGGQLTNRGLIDGALTQLQAATVDNVGTGRVYGDHVAIAAGTLLNRAESVAGVTHAGTVAARQRLDLGVGQLTNTDGALIYTDGDAAIGGALDGNQQAIGNAARVDNLGSTIEIAGTLALHASTLNNVRQNVTITQTSSTAAPVRLDQPSWRHNGPNDATVVVPGGGLAPSYRSDLRSTSNYSALEIYYLNPQDILQDTVYTTPDGYQVHQATIRLTAQTSAYFFARGAMYSATGERSRLDPRTGTVTIYYTGRQDNQVNPDQVSSGASDPFAAVSTDEPGAPPFHYESDTLKYSNAYGTCTRNCVQLIAQYAYTDPDHILSNPQGTGGGGLEDNEQYRIATRSTVQDVLQPGVGPEAVIHAGGAMHLVTDNLHNTYARIAAGGDLSIDGITGAASVTNLAQTLYRTDSFNNVSYAYNGTTRQWSNPSISVQIGQIGGSITSGGTLHIDVGDLSNLNQGRAAPNVQDGSALANLGVQGAQGAVGGGGVGPLHGPGGVSGSSAAQAQSTATQRASATTAQAGAASAQASAQTGTGSAMGTVSGQGTVSGSVAVNAAGGSPDRIVMGTPDTQLPSASLFSVQPNGGHALVETDPRFTNYRVWLSSDAQLRQLGYNADTTQQRLGDGYYEQKLVREQIGQLTGRRFLDGYSSDEAQYQALLDAGATVGKAWGLRPGVALTAAQMAELTSDIVWLVAQTVTLPDGRTTTALVPQVYLRLHPGDLDSGGALLAGANVDAHVSGTLTNTGTIAGRQLVSLDAGRIEHLGGSISGNQVALSSASDLRIQGASVSAVDALSVRAAGNIDVASTVETLQGGGHQEAITRVAGLYVTGANGSGVLSVVGGGDVTLQAAQVRNAGTDGVTQLVAGHDLSLGAQTLTRSTDITGNARNDQRSSQTTHAVSSVQGAGDVVLAAGHDVTLQAAQIGAGKTLAVQAGHDIDSQAVTDTHTQSSSYASKHNSLVTSNHDEHVQGTQLGAGGDIVMRAGNDLSLASTAVASQNGAIALAAGHDVALTATQEQHDSVVDQRTHKSGFLSSKTTTTHDETHDSLAVTSSLSGDTVHIAAGNDLLSQGAQIVGTGDVVLAAGNNLTLETAQNTHSEEHDSQRKKSGLFGGGGLNFTIGKQSLKTDATSSTLTHTGSTVGSLDGNVTLVAGNTLAITGSDVMALQGDITAKAKDIAITEVHDTSDSMQKSAFKQGGLTVSVTSAALNLAQSAVHSAQAGSQAKGDARMQALAGASAAYSAYGASQSLGKMVSADSAKDAGINVAITVGGSRSHSESEQHSDTVKGSTLHAGGNVTLIATGGGDDSNLLIRGSDVKAGNNLLLAADHDITVESAQDSSEQHSRSKSGSAAIGVGFSYGPKGGAMGVTASASSAHGQGDGTDVTQRNSHLSAGNTATIISGNDTTLDGAVLSANKVMADVGGDLHIHSEQDTSHYASHDTAAGGSITAGIGASGSASYSHSKVDGDFASVTEQSGIQAGDGGFAINVHGNTDLKGGVIASTQAAIDQGRNQLTTGTLTVADITNTSHYTATGVNLSGGYAAGGSNGKPDGGSDGSSGDSASNQMPSTADNGSRWSWQNVGSGANGTAAGYDSKSGSQTSITHSGISGGELTITDAAGQQAKSGKSIADTLAALNRDVHTGDSGNGLVKDWNGQHLQQQVTAGAEIMATFGQQASKAIGDYAEQKTSEAAAMRLQAGTTTDPDQKAQLIAQADQLDSQWGANGTLRVLAHTAVGGLTGGVGGAAGAAAGTLTAPAVAEALRNAGVTGPLADALTGLASTAVGAVAGGASGAATAGNEVANNYLNHQQITQLQSELASCSMIGGCDEVVQKYIALSKSNDLALQQTCSQDPSGSACQQGVREALSYVGDQSWKEIYPLFVQGSPAIDGPIPLRQMDGDINSSRKNTLDLVFGNRQAYAAINDIIPRADFFGAMARQTGAVWFAAAESQSRGNLSGPGFDLLAGWNKAFGAGDVMSAWRSAAGDQIMKNGHDSFSSIYYGGASIDPVQWSFNQLGNEQRDPILQKIHEKYVGMMKGWGTVSAMQIFGRVDDLLNPEERIKTGCKNMGYGSDCAGIDSHGK